MKIKPIFLLPYFLFLGNSLFSQNRHKADSLIRTLKPGKQDTDAAVTLNTIGYVLVEVNQKESLYYSTLAKTLSVKIDFKNGIANAFNNIGLVNYNTGNYDSALTNYSKALEINEKIDNKKGLADVYCNIGNVYYDKGDYGKAISYQLKSLDIEKQRKHEKGIADSYYSIGTIYEKQALYDIALDYYLKDLKIEEKIHNQKGIADGYNNLGNIYLAKQLFDKAIYYYLQSIIIKRKLGDAQGIAYSQDNMGNAWIGKHEYLKGFHYCDSALSTLQHEHNVIGEIDCFYNMGRASFFVGDYDKAMQNDLQALALSRSSENDPGIASSLISIGQVYSARGNYAAALRYFSNAEMIAREIQAKEQLRDAYDGLSGTYLKMHKSEDAYRNYVLFAATRDSILMRANDNNINELQIKYDTEKKDSEIEQQAVTISHQNREKVYQFTAIVAVFILLAIGFYIYRRKKELVLENQIFESQIRVTSALFNFHFISGCLNSLQYMFRIRQDAKAAQYLTDFGSFIRKTLEYSVEKQISLKNELENLNTYIDLVRPGLDHPLDYVLNIDENIDTDATFIPSMIIQPFVENSIKHGLGTATYSGKIVINIKIQKLSLEIRIIDNGTGIGAAVPKQDGRKSLGLPLTIERLEYFGKIKKKDTMVLISDRNIVEEMNGTTVILHIPLVTA